MQFLSPKPILFAEEKLGVRGMGVVTLNRPQVLNALNTQCYNLMTPRLLEWEEQEDLAFIVLDSSSSKAFCAGGDVKSLVLGLSEKGITEALDFFTAEYFFDALLHSYKKPRLAFLDGITMGGGMGLFMGCDFRLATLKAQFAMPETAIGLFPDVGATRFLHNFPGQIGYFLGMTGVKWGAHESLAWGLLSGVYSAENIKKMRTDLLRLNWQKNPEENNQILKVHLKSAFVNAEDAEAIEKGRSSSAQLMQEWESYFSPHTLREEFQLIDEKLKAWMPEHPLLQEGVQRYKRASPTSLMVFHMAYSRHKDMTMIEALIAEWSLALRFCANSDFTEGVRALLIDKDHSPKWQMPNEENIAKYFMAYEPNLLREKLQKFRRQVG